VAGLKEKGEAVGLPATCTRSKSEIDQRAMCG
jgi:hypothetical protein